MRDAPPETSIPDESAPPREAVLTAREDAATIVLHPSDDELIARWEGSLSRSRHRRGTAGTSRRRLAVFITAVGAMLAGATIVFVSVSGEDGRLATGRTLRASHAQAPRSDRGPARIPSAEGLRAAERYAERRGGLVSFAAAGADGRVVGVAMDRPYLSASVVKAMLLEAELERLARDGLPLDSSTRDLLTRMITSSDNAAADAIYYRVGDAGLYDVAAGAAMRAFAVSGYWANAQITARDMAGFMWRLRELLPPPHREFALSLLERVVPQQSWGIPAAVDGHWKLRFKGGWRSTELGQLVHQVAELQHSRGSRLALAVLTDAQPSQGYGIETIRGIADRLISQP